MLIKKGGVLAHPSFPETLIYRVQAPLIIEYASPSFIEYTLRQL
jgi:hypothetical protein